MSSKTISIKIPVHLEDEILKHIKQLNILEEDVEILENKEDNSEYFEVEKIKNHKIDKSGEYIFEVKCKGDYPYEWIKDSNLDCEETILKYKNIPTVYVFCRVSTNNQIGEDHVSLEAQESELLKMAKEKFPAHRIKSYKISGSAYRNIPSILQMIGKVAQQDSHILVYRIDRLSRNIIKYLSWMEDLNERGVGIHSLANNISYNKNKLMFIQSVLDSQKESALISDRIKMSIKKRKERGDEGLGNLEYGKKYFRSVDGGKLVIVDNLEERKVIEYIKKSKEPSFLVASNLNNKNIKKRGKKWSYSMINKIRPEVKIKK
jgi:DNA invertase Pin-like site-specific DNA recombinase